MEVTLLGTGSADGWPNAFCRCASCATQAAAADLRTDTSVLVDDRLLLDCGPETPRAALRSGRRLDRLVAVLITHPHPDHSAATALLSGTRAGRTGQVVVAGPAAALDLWRPWVAPDAPVRWHPLEAGDVLEVDGYTVRALPAGHGRPALVYLVEDAEGRRLLHGAVTGPLPEPAVAALADRPVDLLLLDETFGDHPDHGTDHLHLRSFPAELARLRAAGALRAGAQVVAVHLGHHNPPEPRLTQRLSAWDARPGRDGETLTVGATSEPRQGAPRRTLVLGGARSGKSEAAERLLAAEPRVTYVATGPAADGTDASWDERVQRHRESRPASWTTLETTDLPAALRDAAHPVLVDCLGTWLTAVLTEAGAWDDVPGWHEHAASRVEELLAAWRDVAVPVVAVSNEVGSGVVPAHASGIVFRDWLGRLNRSVADASEQVLMVVAGRVLELP